jgi:hypothetical protein
MPLQLGIVSTIFRGAFADSSLLKNYVPNALGNTPLEAAIM